ncbi:MAG TPA: Gldg family protein [Planctomycetota bacterium]|nr:Gldg family protein [Planctomycetota bacterium]
MKAALAIARRDLVRWFTNPTGYVFITVFIALCGAAQFLQEEFFLNNLANLAPLNSLFPYILLFFAPAIAMGTWADERRHGTDELLLTLPVPDLALVAGKYLAALGIYAVSLAFSLVFIIVLGFLGRPDVGLMFGTYLGYAFLGAALISIAMVGSLLVESVTVGFILGAVFCAIPVFLGAAENQIGELIANAGVREAFRDFSVGVVSLKSIVYFAGLAASGLTINLYLIKLRRLRSGLWHLPARLACLLVSAVALFVLAGRSGARVDVTAERLHSLMPQTRETIRSVSAERPVFIQAYVSPEVPQNYVETRENLLGLLREVDALGGGRIHVRVVETTDASDAAREAEDRYKIRPVTLTQGDEGRGSEMEVFLGVAVTSGLDEVVVPFLYRRLSPEYEVTRSIRAVMNAKRSRVGVLATDAKWFGSFDFASMRQSPEWEVVEDLKRQYDVVSVPPDAPIAEAVDVLIVPLPSSLPQAQLDHLFNYVKQGKPALLLDDPLTGLDPSLGANEMRGGRQGMMGGQPPEPKGNFREFYGKLGVRWEPLDIVWDTYRPHPKLPHFEPEIIFVGKGNGAPEPFSKKSSITAKLQELVFIFGGSLHGGEQKGIAFTPLVQAGKSSGILSYGEVWRNSPFTRGGGLNPARRHVPSAMLEGPILAARAQGKEGDVSVNAVVVADLDVASPIFYKIRREEWKHFENLDNVTFILNCVDALAGNETMIELRSRKPRHRTLETVEALKRGHDLRQLEETRAEEEKAKDSLAKAQASLDEAIRKIESRTDLDARTKEIQVDAVRETEQRKFDIEKRRIEGEKEAAIRKSKWERDQQVRAIQGRISKMALLLPPVPALLIGIFALVFRIRRELEARR